MHENIRYKLCESMLELAASTFALKPLELVGYSSETNRTTLSFARCEGKVVKCTDTELLSRRNRDSCPRRLAAILRHCCNSNSTRFYFDASKWNLVFRSFPVAPHTGPFDSIRHIARHMADHIPKGAILERDVYFPPRAAKQNIRKVRPTIRKVRQVDTACFVCNLTDCEGGSSQPSPLTMLLCEKCNVGCHLQCHDPPIDAVPPGDWLCPRCTTNEYEQRRQQRIAENNAKLLDAGIRPDQELQELQELQPQPKQDRWDVMFRKLHDYCIENRRMPRARTEAPLRSWVDKQLRFFHDGTLPLEHKEKLDTIACWSWEKPEKAYSTRSVGAVAQTRRHAPRVAGLSDLPDGILIIVIARVCRIYTPHRLDTVRSLLLANKRLGTVMPKVAAQVARLLLGSPSDMNMPLYMQLNVDLILGIVSYEGPLCLKAALRDAFLRLASHAESEAHNALLVRAPSIMRLSKHRTQELAFRLMPYKDDRGPALGHAEVPADAARLVPAATVLFAALRHSVVHAIQSETYRGVALYRDLSPDDIEYVVTRIGGVGTTNRIDGRTFYRTLDSYLRETHMPLKQRPCLAVHGPLCFWDLTNIDDLMCAVQESSRTLRHFTAQFMFCGDGFFHTRPDFAWVF